MTKTAHAFRVEKKDRRDKVEGEGGEPSLRRKGVKGKGNLSDRTVCHGREHDLIFFVFRKQKKTKSS